MRSTLFSLLSIAAAVQAHMQLNYPPPFNASNNPHTTGPSDPYLQFPYNCCGPNARWEYPCRGYLSLLGTPAGAPVASWAAGSKQNFNLTGIGNHYGGSCQVGFSVDKGKTFQVATSYEGNCPLRNNGASPAGQNFDFTVPADMPTGDAVFAWTWVNREQEFNMNCAAVTITGDDANNQASGPGQTQGQGQGQGQQESGSTPPGYSGAPDPSVSAAQQASATPSSSTAASKPSSYSLDNCVCTCASTSPISSSTVQGSDCTCTCNAALTHKRHTHPHPRYAGRHHAHPRSSPLVAGPHVGAVRVGGAEKRKEKRAEGTVVVAFARRPQMLVADTGNGCRSPKKTAELKYPDPGPDVVAGDGEYPLELPTGEC